jgi:hypothetical protein
MQALPRQHARATFLISLWALAQVGLVACNDYIILESCIYRILKSHFGGQPYYAQLLDFFHEARTRPLLPAPLTPALNPPVLMKSGFLCVMTRPLAPAWIARMHITHSPSFAASWPAPWQRPGTPACR